MKIGIFDSGIGGLLIAKAISKKLPQYDYVYLGDTKRVPYGDHHKRTIYEWTRQGVDYLFQQNCQLVILGCNTASVHALRKLQREYLPTHYPARRILGVIVPTVEVVIAAKVKSLGLIGTKATIQSGIYEKELHKKSKIEIIRKATPLLVPAIEANDRFRATNLAHKYLKPLLQKNIDGLILGCTHYIQLKREIRKLAGPKVTVFFQDEIVPRSLKLYLNRHQEIKNTLSQRGTIHLLVTELTPVYQKLIQEWFGNKKPKIITL